jgi:tetratricopeptide (TPR) repeat protein
MEGERMSRLEQLQKLLAKEPDDSFLNFGVAMELAKVQRFDESLAQFNKTIELDPNYIAAHFQKGRTLISMGDEDRARAALETGIRQAELCGETHAQGEMQELLASL